MGYLSGNDFTLESPKTYIVLGAHRSGTSFVADSLRSAGVDFKTGGWRTENGRGARFNRDIIQAAGGVWYDPPAEAAMLAAGALRSAEIQDMYELLMMPTEEYPLVGFKDPRMALTVRSYLDFLLGDVYLICVFRRPELTAASLKRKGQISAAGDGGHLAKEYARRIISAVKEFMGL